MTIAVFDIDGVVADVRHRLHHIEGPGRRSWNAFFRAAGKDDLLPEGARLVADLATEHEIVWLTGRPEWIRNITRAWLDRQGLPDGDLLMRPDGDYRPAASYKLEELRRLGPRGIAGFVDDDAEVVQAAVAAGFPAVFADWLPRDRALREAQDKLGRT